jgi:hypothetical protein
MQSRVALIFFAVLGTVSCDPTVGASFSVTPAAPPPVPDSEVRDALSIAGILAERYGLQLRSNLQPRDLAAYFTEIADSQAQYPLHNELDFRVRQFGDGTISFTLMEAITRTWSLKGDSLRQALRDTLSVRFPSRINER